MSDEVQINGEGCLNAKVFGWRMSGCRTRAAFDHDVWG